MLRRDFMKSTVAIAVAGELGIGRAQGMVPAHNWGGYDFGGGPKVTDRLNQGPFPQYPPDAVIPNDDVVMSTTPSDGVVPNYGKGLITYITADMGTEEIKSDNVSQEIEDLVRFPLGQQLYIRPTWREVQPKPGRLEMPDYLKLVFDLAKKNNKRIGMRVQMCAPDYTHEPALPDFVLDKVPKVDLIFGDSDSDQESRASGQRYLQNPHSRYQPRYDHPFSNRHSGNWLASWLRNSMATRSLSSSTLSCTASGAKAIPGHSRTILSPITRQQSAHGSICSKSRSSTFPRLLC